MTEDRTPWVTLGMTLLAAAVDEYAVGLRIARDAEGIDVVPTAKSEPCGPKRANQRGRAERSPTRG